MSNISPLPYDPSQESVAQFLARTEGTRTEAMGQDWVLGQPGDYQAGAVQIVKTDGLTEAAVAVEWPGRFNKTDEAVKVRLITSPQDAIGLGEVLIHTGRWLLDAQSRTPGTGKTNTTQKGTHHP